MATTVDPTLLWELFLQRLPSNVRIVLTPSATDLTLDQLAQLADRIVEASPTATIAAADTHTQLSTQVSELTQRLDQLTSQMTSAINNLSSRQTRSPSPAQRRRHNSSAPMDDAQPLCWYHRAVAIKVCFLHL